MALSSRERYIALGVGATVLFAGLYQLVIDPFFEESRVIETKHMDVKKKLAAADVLFKRRVSLRPIWTDMNKSGGLKSDVSESETQVQELLAGWAKESGLAWTSEQPNDHLSIGSVDRKSDKPEAQFESLGVHATGSGTMAQIANLLWKVESAPKLLRITEIHITPKKEGTDNLQIQLNVATVSLIPGGAPANTAAPQPSPGKADTGVEP